MFFLSAVFAAVAFASHGDTISIAGRVSDTHGLPVDGLIVTALQVADSSVAAYSMTDEDGRYGMQLVTEAEEILVRLTGFNVKRQMRRIRSVSQTVNFRAEEESIALREVQIKAQKLWGNRDTLNYLVAAYITDYDRTIGDVLKQLPGITIDGGVIKYQGEPINHFYIENMDVLQGRYKIAVDGLKADDVATVQVLENHEHVKALQDQVPPESAAINLRLKEKAKGVWTGTLGLGLGYDDDMMWNCDANLTYFDKKRQHVIYYGADNTGKGAGRSSEYYGGSGIRTTVLTDILYPGLSPTGSALRNNEHALHVNNVNKLNETAQLHYNLMYNHDMQRRSSYMQTAYLMPGSEAHVISENLSSRRTTNDANIQMTYENNAERKFLSNRLDVSGQWCEANGIARTNGDKIRQHAYNRNLGLANSTRWVHRTEGGAGFELTSRNTVQTTPQALSVCEDMDARQEVDIMRISTSNNFSLIKDLRRHRWSIAPTAAINVNYVGVKSMLRSSISDSGDMDYLQAEAGVGMKLIYANDGIRLTFRLPIALSHTDVKDEADKTQARFSPSFSFLWRVDDNWTLSCNGNYDMNQTPWNKLITSYIMTNYRTANRYVVNLSDSHSAAISAKLNFKDIMNSFFVYVQGLASRSWSDMIYGTTIDENVHTVMQAEYMPHHDDTYSLTGSVTKGLDWKKARMEAKVNYTRTDGSALRQSVTTRYHSDALSVHANLSAAVVQAIRIGYDCNYIHSKSAGKGYSHSIRTFGQHANLDVSFISNRLMMNLTARHTHDSDMQGKKDYAFMDAALTYRTKKKHDFILEASNIFNTRTFVSRSDTELNRTVEIYRLRPRGIMLITRFNL